MSTNKTFAAKFNAPINKYIKSVVKLKNSGIGSGCSCGNCSSTSKSDALFQAIAIKYILDIIQNQQGCFDQFEYNNANIGHAENGRNEFYTIDSSGNGKISRAEYENYFMRQKEMEIGERIDKNHPHYAHYKREAKNLYNALKGSDGTISQKRFNKMIQFFDRADGAVDGRIDNNYMKETLTKIKQEGSNTDILNGKTLRQLINLEG